MDIAQLKYFISVAQTLNFSEAARQNGLTQPGISHHINELEKQLGARLFVRTKRHVAVTDAGRSFLPYAMEIVNLTEKAAFQVHRLEEGACGNISIACLPTISDELCQCLNSFTHSWPDIMVDIALTSGRSLLSIITESKHDFYFASRDMIPKGDTFDQLYIKTGNLALILNKDHPLAASKELDFSELKKERFIAVSESECPDLARCVNQLCRQYSFRPRVTAKYDSPELAVFAVGSGLGITIVPEALYRTTYSSNVVFIPLDCELSKREEVVAWRKELTNPAAKLFLSILRERYQQDDDK